MNTKIFSLLFLIPALPVLAASEETRIITLSGNVEARTTPAGQWAPAAVNMEIPDGGAVRSGADGSALLLMPNKTRIWIKESSSLELEQRQTLSSRLALLFGKIKVRVPHLLRKEKFEIRTPTAVCAVRGTELTVDTNEAGALVVNVMYGEVKLHFVVPPEKGSSDFYIPQGRSMSQAEKGKLVQLVLMSHKQEVEALENWSPGLTPEERRKDMKAKANDKALIREFAKIVGGTDAAVKSFLNTVKESDLEGGRTLRDIHGNVVRVDQRMMRPYADEVQIVNLVKRPVYNNADSAAAANARGGFAYNGAQGVANRLDYMQMTMNFNKNLPQRIEEWPGFFNSDSVKAEWSSAVMANKTNAKEIFFIAEGARYDAVSDELRSNTGIVGVSVGSTYGSDNDVLITGVLRDDSVTGVKAVEGLNNIARLNIADNGTSDGALKYSAVTQAVPIGVNSPVNGAGNAGSSKVVWAVKMNYENMNLPGPFSYEKKGDPLLYYYQATPYSIGGVNSSNHTAALGNAGIFWFTQESSVINNAGALRQVSDFTSSSLDPFSILKNTAGEVIMSIKQNNNYAPVNWTSEANIYNNAISQNDYFKYNSPTAGIGTNIDLVIIPDLLIAGVQRILPALTKLN